MRTPPRWRTEGDGGGRRGGRPVCALAVVVGIVVMGVIGAITGPAPAALAGGDEKPTPEAGRTGDGSGASLASSELRELLTSGGATLDAVTDSVTVEVVADDTTAAAAAVEELGGKVDGEVAGWLVQARVPVSSLVALEARDVVRTVRPPALTAPPPPIDPGAAQASPAEAVTEAGADGWHTAGFTGAGVRVGIIDYFNIDDWNAAIVSGDLPAPAGTFCRFEGTGCTIWLPRTEGTGHGVAVAEVIADMAPDAELYLATVGSTADLQAAVDWFAGKGVDIVSRSLTSEFDGPGDGTGPVAAVIDDAVSQGIAWFNAAGNAAGVAGDPVRQGDYWRGTWNDPDGDGWLDFAPGDEDLAFRCGFLNGLRWSDWDDPNATDYDVYVYEQPGQGGRLIEDSKDDQPTADPVELLSICPKDGNGNPIVAYLRVRLVDGGGGAAGDVIEFMLNQGMVEHWSNPHSASGPAADTASPGAMAVGAVDPAGGDTIAWYSSRGPTNDGRVKPDLVAPSCLDTNTYLVGYASCFNGTSAATPVVAGAAALARQSGVATTPATVVSWLRTHAADRGPAGADNTYGWGELRLPSPPARGCPPDDGNEPDDTRGEATTVANGVTVTAVACDDDWYELDLATGDTITVDLDFFHASGNLDLALFDPSDMLVASATSTTDGEVVSHKATTTGVHTVRVRPAGAGQENGYRITLTSDGECPPDDGHEDNDTRSAATDVVDGIVTLGLACTGDADWYELEVNEGETIVAGLDFTRADGDLGLALFAPGAATASPAVITPSTDHVDLTFSATQSGPWAVRVTSGATSNDYRLIVTTGGVCPPDDGFEENDSRGAARPLTDGVTIAGIACDDDWYSIDVEAGQGITAQLDFAHDGGDLDMRLLDPSGTAVGYGLSISDDETITHVAGLSGTYTVNVYGYYGAENEYDLTVSLGAVDPCAANPIQPFFDVSPTSYAWDSIACIFALGITRGTSSDTYSPGAPVTREQMAAFLARTYTAIHGTRAPVVPTPFIDLSPSSFALDDVARIYGLGITTGTSPTTYSPTEAVTREQMAAFLARLHAVLNRSPAPVVPTPFTDLSPSSFALHDIARIYGLGVTRGTSPTTYSPTDVVTREQMAAFLERLYRTLIAAG